MAFITFIAKKRNIASFVLSDGCVLGRSLDCDVFVPDMFISREHCRFRKTRDGWTVIDQRSRNGLYLRGQRIRSRLLHPGDIIEVGTIAFRFEGDLPADGSNPTPFGESFPLVELVDTVFAESLHPNKFTKTKRRTPAWKRRALVEVEDIEGPLPMGAMAVEPLEWAELDMEVQIDEQAEEIRPAFVLVAVEEAERIHAAGEGKGAAVAAGETKSRETEEKKPRVPATAEPKLSRPERRTTSTSVHESRCLERCLDQVQALRDIGLAEILELVGAHKVELATVSLCLCIVWFGATSIQRRMEIRRIQNTPLTINDRVAQGN